MEGIVTKDFIVITTINPPSDAIMEILKLEDFQIIVVGDRKTPKNWQVESENIFFLSIESILRWSY